VLNGIWWPLNVGVARSNRNNTTFPLYHAATKAVYQEAIKHSGSSAANFLGDWSIYILGDTKSGMELDSDGLNRMKLT
jgi:hypothetical protein